MHARTKLTGTLVPLTAALALCLTSIAQDLTPPHPTGSVTPPITLRQDLVDEYWYGEDLGSYSLTLRANGSFEWKSHGCGVGGQNEGTYEVIGGLLVLSPVDEEVTSLGGKRFIPVKWGERLYLIPEAIRAAFRDEILEGREPRIGTGDGDAFYLRNRDWGKPVSGVPTAPAPWRDTFRDLVPLRIEAQVTDVWQTTWEGSDVTLVTDWARLDAGKRQGLRPGMWLTVEARNGTAGRRSGQALLAIDRVEEDSADAKIIDGGAGNPAHYGVVVGSRATITTCVISPDFKPEPPSIEQLAANEAARKFLAEVARTYASCRSYRDEGIVETVYVKEGGDQTRRLSFSTRFVRPDRFRFEYGHHDSDQYAPACIIWQKRDRVRDWQVSLKPQAVGELSFAIAGATGVSSGSAHTIPCLLIPNVCLTLGLSELDDIALAGEETLDGTVCVKLKGNKSNLTRITLWVERESRLVRKIVEESQFAAFRTRETTTYRPRINTAIPDADLAFDPPAPSDDD